jgi:hypothetical protein
MILVASIALERAEGPSSECYGILVGSYEEADRQLRAWSETAPADYGYDKVDVAITYEDGGQYHGRYDLKHHSIKPPDLAREIRCRLRVAAGYDRPESWKRENYRRWLMRNRDYQAEAIRFLDAYDVGSAA